jgi:spermidine synthase
MCRRGVGEPVGLAYGINTAGAILGSLIAGFMLIPHLGLQHTITVANASNWVAGAVLLGVVGAGRPAFRWGKVSVAVLLGVLVTVFMPAWDVGIMNSGPFVYAARSARGQKIVIDKKNILFHMDGVDTSVMVIKTDKSNIALRINGKTDASTGPDMSTQELCAHIPMLFHPDPREICIIGLASGMTLGSVTRHPVDSVDVMELSQVVVEAAEYFKDWNYNAVHDPRVTVIVGDGRNHLLMTKKKYDVVISEPSNPWIAGEAALFTKEYFESVRDHLAPGGMFCCWLQAYQMPPDQFRMVMRTCHAIFPEVTLWETINSVDYILVGSLKPLRIDPAIVESRMKSKNVAEDLSRVSIGGVIDLLGRFVLGPRRFMMVAGNGEYHVDDRMQLEYMTPRYLYHAKNFYPELYDKAVRFAEHPMVIIGSERSRWPEGFGEALNRETKARDIILNAMYFSSKGDMEKAIELFAGARKISPNNVWNKNLENGVLDEIETRFADSGKYNEAIAFFRRAVQIDPENADLRDRLGSSYMYFQRTEEARKQFEIAIAFDPKDHRALYGLGFINLYMKNFGAAEENLRRCIEAKPDYSQAYSAMGVLMEEYRKQFQAESYYRKAIELDSMNAFAYANLGVLLVQQDDEKKRKEGRTYIEKAISLDPELAKREDIIQLLRTRTR